MDPQATTVNPEPSPPPKPRLPLIVGAIALLTVGLTAGLFLGNRSANKEVTSYPTPTTQPTPTSTNAVDETANWKTYESKTFGYSVKYQPTIEVDDEHDAPPSALFHPLGYSTKMGAPSVPTYYISVMKNPPEENDTSTYNRLTKENLDELYAVTTGQVVNISKNLQPPYSDYWNYKRLPDETVNNVTGLVIENNKVWEGYGNDRRVLLKKNNMIYMIGTYYQNTTDLSSFERFLSTFKFTNNNVVNNSEVEKAVATYMDNHKQLGSMTRTETKENDGVYASGYVYVTNNGYEWFAAKINGVWTVVHVGKEPPFCKDVAQYNLPKSFLNCLE